MGDLNNKTKYVGKISEGDLKEIKEFSKDIKSESTSGDWIGSNSSKNINELINIIKKYTYQNQF